MNQEAKERAERIRMMKEQIAAMEKPNYWVWRVGYMLPMSKGGGSPEKVTIVAIDIDHCRKLLEKEVGKEDLEYTHVERVEKVDIKG